MPDRCRAACFSTFGPPAEALAIRVLPLPPPSRGEALVRMHLAPVNPADLNLIEGTYGLKPTLPAFAGLEGVGMVEEVGLGCELRIGDLVRPIDGIGTWRNFAVGSAASFLRLPPLGGSYDLVQAAMLSVNPATAWQILEQANLPRGSWVIQNAAGSNLGRCLIQLARERGLRTINLVRRMEIANELKALGADAVFADTRESARMVAELCGDHAPALALNQVGGESAMTLAKCVAPGATVVTVGALAKQPLSLATGLLIFKDVRFTGFWITRWYAQASPAAREHLLSQLATLTAEGKLWQPVATTVPLSRIADALAAVSQPGRNGKVLLDCQA